VKEQKVSKKAAWLIAMVFILLLSACSNNKNGQAGGENTPAGSTSPSSTTEATAAPEAPKETINIKIMGNFSSANLSETDKLLVAAIEEKTNTKIEFDIPPSTGYNERQQLMLTTGEYPDLVYFSSPSNASFLNAVSEGAIIPINKYLEGADNVLKYTYDVSWDALKVNDDENIYGLPRTSVIRADAYFVRKDWLEAVNITLPEDNQITLDQMIEILEAFSNGDPDRNGMKDTYGLGAYASGDKTLNPEFRNEHGFYGWQEASGGDYKYMSPQYDLNSTVYTNALALTAKLYKNGLMDPDAPLLDGGTALDRFKSGKTGVYGGFAGNYEGILKDGKAINPNFELDYVFVKNEQGEQKGLGQGTGLFGFWAITTAAKDPQRIVDIFDYLLSDEGWEKVYNGMEGYDYKVENGQKVFAEKPLEVVIRKNIVRRAGDYMFFISPDMPQEDKDIIVPHIQLAVERMVLSKDRGFTPSIARTPEYLDFNKKLSETTTRIVVGDAPVEAYLEVLKEWHDKFGEQYLTEMNAYIEKMEKQQ